MTEDEASSTDGNWFECNSDWVEEEWFDTCDEFDAGSPLQAPGPPKLCMMGCGRCAHSQTNFRSPAPCCAMCYHHNGHSDQCNLANGIDPEPEPDPDPPDPDPDPDPEPDYDTDVEIDYAQEVASPAPRAPPPLAAPLVVGHSPFSGLLDPSVHSARGGKSKERRLAELMTGPVVVPEPIESADSAKHRESHL